ncbi:MAG TPA: hypothetical protein DCZ94_09815 [Lentisphaeria bacterium]|nr:MAG: hypothetical protein A2X48_19055 [Lentisphaerae bacterium GWF2_49_21]HBC87239.1 hypothetical protein [Lentisphaeria bacterium]
MYRIMKDRNEAMKDEVRDFASELLKISSISQNEKKAAEFICGKMKQLGYDDAFIDNAGNAIGVIRGRTPEAAVILNSHIDTVSPDEEKWTMPPLSGKIEDGKLMGVGASDCKAGLASQIFAGALLKRSLLPMRGPFVVAATVAEENGCSIGLRKFVSDTLPSLGMKAGFAILGEPTGNGLYYGHDGWVEVNIHIEGANPFQVSDTARSINSDLSLVSINRNKFAAMEEMSIGRPVFNDNSGFRAADMCVSKRLRGSESSEEVVSWLNHEVGVLVQNERKVAVEVAVISENQKMYNGSRTIVKRVTNAWQTDPYSPLMQRARQSLSAAECEVRTGKWNLGRLGMGTAGSVFSGEFKIPVIGYGPGTEECAHAPDEFVLLDKIYESVYGTAAIVHGLVGIPVCGWTSDEI